jgi:hypothetical protein
MNRRNSPAVIPRLEPLEMRECPSAFALARGGTQARDVIMGRAANCAFASVLAGAASAGVDLLGRLERTAPGRWRVLLYTPRTAEPEPVWVPVRFTGASDMTLRGGEYWPELFADAYRRLAPWSYLHGDTLEGAGRVLFGKTPAADDSLQAVGLPAMKAALAAGGVVVVASDSHAWTFTGANPEYVRLYDAWGLRRRIPTAAFLRRPLEAVILSSPFT